MSVKADRGLTKQGVRDLGDTRKRRKRHREVPPTPRFGCACLSIWCDECNGELVGGNDWLRVVREP